MNTDIPVYIISLARAVERRRRVNRLVASAGVGVTIVDATDACASEFLEEVASLIHPEYPGCVQSVHDRPITLGEAACNDSHRRCLMSLAESDCHGAVILEDDVTFDDRLSRVIADLGNDQRVIDHGNLVIYIGDTSDGRISSSCVLSARNSWVLEKSGCRISRVVRFKRDLFGAHGYYVSRKVAVSILKNEPRFGGLSDLWQLRLKARVIRDLYALEPSAVLLEKSLPSDLEAHRTAVTDQAGRRSLNSQQKLFASIVWKARAGVDRVIQGVVDPVLRRLL